MQLVSLPFNLLPVLTLHFLLTLLCFTANFTNWKPDRRNGGWIEPMWTLLTSLLHTSCIR